MGHSWFKEYSNSYLMDSKFGSFQGYRIYYPADQVVMKRLKDLKLNADEQYESVQSNFFGSKASAYRILHRLVTAQKMRSLFTAAEEPSLQANQATSVDRSKSSFGGKISNVKSYGGNINLTDSRGSGLRIGHTIMLLLSGSPHDARFDRQRLPLKTPASRTMHQIPGINSFA